MAELKENRPQVPLDRGAPSGREREPGRARRTPSRRAHGGQLGGEAEQALRKDRFPQPGLGLLWRRTRWPQLPVRVVEAIFVSFEHDRQHPELVLVSVQVTPIGPDQGLRTDLTATPRSLLPLHASSDVSKTHNSHGKEHDVNDSCDGTDYCCDNGNRLHGPNS